MQRVHLGESMDALPACICTLLFVLSGDLVCDFDRFFLFFVSFSSVPSQNARIAPNLDRAEATVSCAPARRDPRSLARTWLNPGGPRSPNVLPRDYQTVLAESHGASGLRVSASIKGLRNTDLPRLRDPGYEAVRLPTLDVRIAPRRVDIGMFDGILDLPLDLLGGEASGELILRAHSAASWRFPQLEGHLDVRYAGRHVGGRARAPFASSSIAPWHPACRSGVLRDWTLALPKLHSRPSARRVSLLQSLHVAPTSFSCR